MTKDSLKYDSYYFFSGLPYLQKDKFRFHQFFVIAGIELSISQYVTCPAYASVFVIRYFCWEILVSVNWMHVLPTYFVSLTQRKLISG